MKVCTRCKIEKEDSEFRIDKRYGTLNSYCNTCNKEFSKEYYQKVRRPKEYKGTQKIAPKVGIRHCDKCNTDKDVSEFYAHGGFTCKVCHNKLTSNRYEKNKDVIKIREKKYREKNIDIIKEKAKERRIKNNHNAYSNKKNKEYRQALTDGFVKKFLRDKGVNDITEDKIESERVSLLIKRLKNKIEETGNIKACLSCMEMKDISEYEITTWVWKGVRKYGTKAFCRKCNYERYKRYKNK